MIWMVITHRSLHHWNNEFWLAFIFISPHQHRENHRERFSLSTVQNTNKNLFDCQRGFSFKVGAELLSMECKVEIDSTYICRNCCQRKRNESALHEVIIALFKRLSTRKRLPLFLTSQCDPNALLWPLKYNLQSVMPWKIWAVNTPRKITAHRQRSVLFWRSEPYLSGRLPNTSFPLKSASML